MRMPPARKDLSLRDELLRKILHMAVGLFGLLLGLYIVTAYGNAVALWTLFAALILLLIADWLRLEHGVRLPSFRFLQRAREVGRLHAATFAFMGLLVAFTLFDRDIAFAAASMFLFGDAAAAVIGRVYGRHCLLTKTIEGSAAMLIVSFACGWAITGSASLSLVMASVATLVELVASQMDDSFLIILFAGVVGQLLRYL
jgi:dolichol kinase